MDNESFEELEKSVKEAATILSLAQECVDSRKRIKELIDIGNRMAECIEYDPANYGRAHARDWREIVTALQSEVNK